MVLIQKAANFGRSVGLQDEYVGDVHLLNFCTKRMLFGIDADRSIRFPIYEIGAAITQENQRTERQCAHKPHCILEALGTRPVCFGKMGGYQQQQGDAANQVVANFKIRVSVVSIQNGQQ